MQSPGQGMATADRLVRSGLMDEDYYTASYGREALAGQSPAMHFVTTGFARGMKPNPAFDPLVSRLRQPGVAAQDLLAQAITGFSPGETRQSVQSLLPGPITPPDDIDPDRPGGLDPAQTIAYAQQFAKARQTPFTVAGKSYVLQTPTAAELLGRLRDDRPFFFARISHGDWDSFYFASHYRRQLAAELRGTVSDAELTMLAYRLCEELHPVYDNFAENFMIELEADLQSRPRHPDFLMSVAFKGNPTADEEIFEGSAAIYPVDAERLGIFARFFAPGEAVYDANVFKRWLMSGDLRHLPELARRRPVILMGADVLTSLGTRWRLPWFSHIVIPPEFSYPMRRRLLDVCRERVAEAKAAAVKLKLGKPLFLLQGSSFAFWFQARLFASDPDLFSLDLGQALHSWFYDVQEIPLRTWGRRYGPAIVKNCGFADFYRGQGVQEPVIAALFAKRIKNLQALMP